MNRIDQSNSEARPELESNQDFKVFSRPLTSRLLEAMELSRHFYHGEGDFLFFERDQKIHKVLDLTGGYGANLLGHKNPRILNVMKRWMENGSPSLTQGSIRKESGKLAAKISNILTDETGEGPWITTFSNSGTESVEAAYKHSLIYYQHKLRVLLQEVDKEMNQALIRLKRTPDFLESNFRRIRIELIDHSAKLRLSEERRSYLVHQLNNVHDLDELVALLREINRLQVSQKPLFLSLEKSYHGKTMGALSLTANEGFRDAFFLGNSDNTQTRFISQYIGSEELEKLFAESREDLLVLTQLADRVAITKHPFSRFAGAFVEPIQGEAGVFPVSSNLLALLKKFSLQDNFLLVFDEIQAGMFRTGKLASGHHSDITADVYTFSKSLGGGVAKIAATSVIQKRYIEDFGYLHTSTFSDDDFSASVALEVLDILTSEDSPVAEGLRNADYLWARLEYIKNKYPDVIKEVRGKGLMLAVEFEDIFREMGFEFKMICDARMQGYLMASALLNHEDLRMSPSLSNNLTLRIQPSLYFSVIHTEILIRGLVNMCEALRSKNLTYFLSALYPGQEIQNKQTPDLYTKLEPGKRPVTVFLCHLIDEGHIKMVTRALRKVPGSLLTGKLGQTKDLAEFEIYHVQTVKDNLGREMDIVMMGIPMTSEGLKQMFMSSNRYKVVEKVQNALTYAKSLGATTVGLGQFTSIVSGNGLYLDTLGMNVTTGNAFTIGLTVQSALRSASEKKMDLAGSTVALVGAAGNIMSVATSLMADHVSKLILVHHSPIESSLKYQEAIGRILQDIVQSDSSSAVVRVIKENWDGKTKLIDFLNSERVSEVFVATSDITQIKNAEIILCGTSASNGFLTLDLFRENAVIVDVAVPPSIKKDMLAQMKALRPDLTYHMGGVARIPHGQSLNFFLFPLPPGECYACMAETFTVGFSGRKNFLNIGDLNKAIVRDVESLADQVGFVLGSTKSHSSF